MKNGDRPSDGQTSNGKVPRAPPPSHTGQAQATVAVGFVLLLLVLVTTSQGGFQIGRWTPLALFALAVLLGALLARGRLAVDSRAARVALVGIWGLAAWSMASMLWAQSAGDAFAAADRWILFAAIATLPLALPLPRRSLAAATWALAGAIVAVAMYVLIRLMINGAPLVLAGRLNGPINYRNATALLFALPVWPAVIAAATGRYPRVARALALGAATLCLGLAFLTQSRGIVLGLALGGVVVLALGPDRVRRAWTAIITLAAVAVASPWLLRPFHAFDGGHGIVTTHQITVAADALAIAAGAAVVVGMAIALFDSGLRASSARMRSVRLAARLGLTVAVIAALIAAGAAVGNPSTYLSQKWHQFHDLNSATPTTTRLLTVEGQRYDLWRVAVNEFDSAPVLGVGADNYSFDYYRDRATNRNLDDPHSFVFALLAESGIVGTVLFALFLLGNITALGRGWRQLDANARRPAAAAAAIGAVLIGQSAVDWMFLIPGLTSIGIFSLSLATAQAVRRSDDEGPTRVSDGGNRGKRLLGLPWAREPWARVLGVAGVGTAIVAVLALLLSDAYIQRARSEINNPHAELSSARTAHTLDPWSVTPYYLEASALETLGDLPGGYTQLRDALSLEPANMATLAVLGDFEARGHDFAAARRYYRRALKLDPLDTGLQQLVGIGEPATVNRARAKRRGGQRQRR
ncbi:MAG: O-antigen ligase family protein [Solirubrobacteraceae bacterium]